MKTFIVEIQYSHESFNGYEHKDHKESYTVQARNVKSAENKALKLAWKTGGGYDRRVSYIKGI